MKKDFLIALLLAAATSIALQYLFFNRRQDSSREQVRSGQRYTVRRAQEVVKEPLREIDFVDTQQKARAQMTTVVTDYGQFAFSTEGATLESATFLHDISGERREISTVLPPSEMQREQRCFLVAFDQQTPFFFELKSHEETDEQATLVYQDQGDFFAGTLTKTFVIDKRKHAIDMTIDIAVRPGFEGAVQPRVVWPAPHMQALGEADVPGALVNKPDGGSIELLKADANLQLNVWSSPEIFGTHDKYFVHSLVSDPDNFVTWGFYDLGPQQVTSYLEGQTVNTSGRWALSFYFGPKEHDALVAVDPRLTGVLDYGMFAPVSRFMLFSLRWLYDYVRNFGWAIILLTLLMRLLMVPLTLKSERAMKDQKKMQQKLEYLKQKYRHDREALAREQAALMSKHGGGCLTSLATIVVQILMLIALRTVLLNAIELYQAPFLWISDLSAKDPFFVLPFISAASMMIQASHGPVEQRMTQYAMAILMGAFVSSISAGLGLYLATSMAFAAVQATLQRRFAS